MQSRVTGGALWGCARARLRLCSSGAAAWCVAGNQERAREWDLLWAIGPHTGEPCFSCYALKLRYSQVANGIVDSWGLQQFLDRKSRAEPTQEPLLVPVQLQSTYDSQSQGCIQTSVPAQSAEPPVQAA